MKNYFFLLVCFSVLLVACKKDDPPKPPVAQGKYENGILVLNEGLFQQNNASISFYSLSEQKTYTQTFFAENERGLGDTANDFEKFSLNGKEYIIIAVDISSQVEIVEATTLKSVAQIPLFDGALAREPRRVKVSGSRAFVCNFDGTVSVIDLNLNTVITTIEVGANPDGMLVSGNELFVSNSGGLNFPVYDSAVFVIDLYSLTVSDTIETRINSTAMIMDSQSEIYLLSHGNYSDISPALVRINALTHQVLGIEEINMESMTQVGDWIYYVDNDQKEIRRYNLLSESPDPNVIIDAGSYTTLAGTQYVPALDQLFCLDANGYVNSSTIRAYTTSGSFLYEFTAELNATKLIANE